MQRQNNLEDNAGMVTLFLLIMVSSLLTAALGLGYVVNNEIAIQRDSIRKKQILCLGETLMQKTLQEESSLPIANVILPTVKLEPGNYELTPTLILKQRLTVPVRSIEVRMQGENEKFSLYHQRYEPPGGSANAVYKSLIFAGKSVSGWPKSEGKETSKSMPMLDLIGYQTYAQKGLPNAEVLNNYGLGQRAYHNEDNMDGKTYTIASDSKVRGKGILVHNGKFIVGSNTKFFESVWLISMSTLVIEDGVEIVRGLLISRGDILIGNNVVFNGIIVAGGNVIVGNACNLQYAPEVADAFNTVIYYL